MCVLVVTHFEYPPLPSAQYQQSSPQLGHGFHSRNQTELGRQVRTTYMKHNREQMYCTYSSMFVRHINIRGSSLTNRPHVSFGRGWTSWKMFLISVCNSRALRIQIWLCVSSGSIARLKNDTCDMYTSCGWTWTKLTSNIFVKTRNRSYRNIYSIPVFPMGWAFTC